jgi:hypothetical protein
MDKRALAIGIGASLILAAGTANAGTCTTEIQALQSQLGSSDTANATTEPNNTGVQQPSPTANATTGTGVTVDTDSSASTDNNANATIGANGAGVQQPSPSANATTGTSTGTTMDSDTTATADANSGANATIGATDPGVQQPDSGGAQASAEANSNGSSDAIPPTVAETSRAGEMSTSAGGRTSALVAIAKAKQLDQAGQEEACMSEVNTAKQQLGIQ